MAIILSESFHISRQKNISSDSGVHAPASHADFWTSSFRGDHLERMNPLESKIHRIGFNSAVDLIIIFPSLSKYVNEALRMEYNQRVIIRFLHNERADAHDIIQRLQAQFAQGAYALLIKKVAIDLEHHFEEVAKAGQAPLTMFK
jgi:hypothetical protein